MPFQKGRKKDGGRKKGTPNKSTVRLKDAILTAAEFVGENGYVDKESGKIVRGTNGLVGYLAKLAINSPDLFVPLLGRVLPLELQTDGAPVNVQVITNETTMKEISNIYLQVIRNAEQVPEMKMIEGKVDDGAMASEAVQEGVLEEVRDTEDPPSET